MKDKYIQEIEKINIATKNIIKRAKKDYSFVVSFKNEGLNMEEYEEDMLLTIESEKEKHILLGSGEMECYFEIMKHVEKMDIDIRGIQMSEQFHRGAVHHLVNEGKFKWRYND